MRDPAVTPLAKAVALDLLLYAGVDDICFPSLEKIGADLGINRNTIARAIDSLAKRGIIRIKPKTAKRANGYDVTALRAAINCGNAIKSGDEASATKSSITPSATKSSIPSAIKTSTNSDHSVSVQAYNIDHPIGTEDSNVSTEADRAQAPVPESRASDPAQDAPTPSSGSGAPSGGMSFKELAQREAARLGLSTCCPNDEFHAEEDVNELIMLAEGEALNPGMLAKLIEQYGIIRVWTQARYLEERIDRYKLGQGKPVPKVTGFFIRALQANSGIQYGERYSENKDLCREWFCKLLNGSATLHDAPPHVRKWLAYLMRANDEATAEIAAAPVQTDEPTPEELDDISF